MKLAKTAVLLAFAAVSTLAGAGEIVSFDQQVFDKLTHEGKPVVVDVSAPWCPYCKALKPVIDALMKRPAYKDVTLMTVDFDTNKATLSEFGVTMQSTLVTFKVKRKSVGRPETPSPRVWKG